jgi:hypothetical protein
MTSPLIVTTAPRPPGPLGKARRHWQWARTQGVGRLIEEDGLDPRARARSALRKWRWRQVHGVGQGTATPVFLVGVQRSGTNMVVRGLEAAPEFEVHNENDRRAFDRFELRRLPTIQGIVAASTHRFVLFKPLCDSHRVDELLDDVGTPGSGRALWAYRSVDGRVASALAKFGDVNLRMLRAIASGGADDRWQAQRMSQNTLEFIRSFDYDVMSPATAAALFWWARNRLVFELGLDRRDDVALISYDALLADPEPRMREVCAFLDFEWNPSLITHIEQRSPAGRIVEIDAPVRERCTELSLRLEAVRTRQERTC